MAHRDDNRRNTVLRVIAESLKQAEWMPTLSTTRLLAERGYWSTTNVYRAIVDLEEDLLIERIRDDRGNVIPGAIRLPGMPRVRAAPVVGHVAAGEPIPYYGDEVQEYMPLPVNRVRDEDAFLLKVVGDSMMGDAILDGDFVVVVPDRRDPGEDEIVVVTVGDDSTVKRVQRLADGIRLLSSNPDVDPIFVHRKDNPEVRGRVIGVMRWLP